MDFTGTTARDSFIGTIDDDNFDMSQGGRDTVSGLDGDDVFTFGTELNANDQIDGGDGIFDSLVLEGNYVGGLVFAPTTMVGVETLTVLPGYSYALTIDDANTYGFVFHVDASQLGAADSLVFDGSAETDCTLDMTGGAGDDTFIAGGYFHTFHLGMGGDDTAIAGATGSAFHMGGALNAGDSLVGSAAVDTVYLSGDYSAGLVITGGMLVGIDRLSVSAVFAAALTLTDDALVAGPTP